MKIVGNYKSFETIEFKICYTLSSYLIALLVMERWKIGNQTQWLNITETRIGRISRKLCNNLHRSYFPERKKKRKYYIYKKSQKKMIIIFFKNNRKYEDKFSIFLHHENIHQIIFNKILNELIYISIMIKSFIFIFIPDYFWKQLFVV